MTIQMTLDDDFNVPDVKPDVEKIVKEQGNIVIFEVKPQNGKFLVRGELHFELLYVSEDDENPVHSLSGSLPFEEVVNMDEATTTDEILCKWDMEDLSTSLINSRKCSVRAIVSLTYTVKERYEEEVALEIEEEENVWCLRKDMTYSDCIENKKDTYRIKEEIVLPSSKPDIVELLYSEAVLQGVETRLIPEGIHMSGSIEVFILYVGDEEDKRIYYSQNKIPFSGTVKLDEYNEDMIAHVIVNILNKDIQIKADEDGEKRIIDCEVVLELAMQIYEEENIEIVEDVYSTKKEFCPQKKTIYFDQILYKNNSKARISEQMILTESSGKILQICNGTGTVRIEEEEIVEDGIQVEGVVEVQLLYVTDDDESPLGAQKGVVPFRHLVEVPGITKDTVYEMTPYLEELSVAMVDGNDAEVKAMIAVNVIAFSPCEANVISSVEVKELDLNKLEKIPGLVGYIVKEGDTLWSIAKKFFTTTQSIMEQNELDTQEVKPGDKLLLVKKA